MNILKMGERRGWLFEPEAVSTFEAYLDEAGGTVKDVLPSVFDLLAEASGDARGRVSAADMAAALVTLRESTGGGGGGGGAGGAGSASAVSADTAVVVPLAKVPDVVWSERHKRFVHDDARPEAAVGLFPQPSARARVLHNRFYTLKQRVFRTTNFSQPHHSVYGNAEKSSYATHHSGADAAAVPLYRLTSLEGVSTTQTMHVLARLSRADAEEPAAAPDNKAAKQAHKLFLEDDTSRVPVELSEHVGEGDDPRLYFDGCIVVAMGQYRSDGVFVCHGLGMPPAEPRASSLRALATHVDFFGLEPAQNHLPALEARLASSSSHVFVLSQVTLNRATTLQRVANFVKGIAQMTAATEGRGATIVLAGSFIETPFVYGDTLGVSGGEGVGGRALGSNTTRACQGIGGFTDLLAQLGAAIAAAAPSIAANASFVLVPGDNDPAVLGGGGCYPTHPLPDFTAEGFRRSVPTTTLASNPLRLRFLTKEIVVFAAEVKTQLLSTCVVPPSKEPDAASLVRTLADQAHLLPLPPRFAPVCPSEDASLRLYPLPHLVVMCDRYKTWSTEYKGCPFVNPGSFCRNGTFLWYDPRTNGVEVQLVPL